MALLSSPSTTGNFSTPENDRFYSQYKYKALDSTRHEIRLLRLYYRRLKPQDIPHVFPGWAKLDTSALDIGDDDSFLACKLLEQVPLHSASPYADYAALSYCAGSANKTRKLLVNGFFFNAFANLEHALESLRQEFSGCSKDQGDDQDHEFIDLWTDQICIDQQMHEEKSYQVGFMRKIYQEAKSVKICLSTADDEEKHLIDLDRRNSNAANHRMAINGLRSLHSAAQRLLQSTLPFGDADNIPGHFGQLCNTEINECGTLCKVWDFLINKHNRLRPEGLTSLQDEWLEWLDLVIPHILTSTWWQRAWVFQEFLAARELTLFWFESPVSWEQFRDVLLYLPHHLPFGDELNERYEVTRRGNALMKAAAAFRNHGNQNLSYFDDVKQMSTTLPLRTLLQNSFRFKSSDPRDMIYAFIGLANSAYDIKPDYSQSNHIANVVVNATIRIICVEKTLEVLQDVSPRRADQPIDTHDEKIKSLPSWTPDWTKAPNGQINQYRILNKQPYYRSGPSLLVGADTIFEPTFEKLGTSAHEMGLKVNGICVTALDSTSMEGLFLGLSRFKFRINLSAGVLGILPQASIALGDEIWMIVGCSDFVLLRAVGTPISRYFFIGVMSFLIESNGGYKVNAARMYRDWRRFGGTEFREIMIV